MASPDQGDARAAHEHLSQLRLKDHSMKSALQEVADLARSVIPGADDVSVSLVSRDRADTVVFTGAMALDLDERQYQQRKGPCYDAAVEGKMFVVDDMTTERRWGSYPREAAARGALSSVSVPISVQERPRVAAALNVYSKHPRAFDEGNRETATAFAVHAEAMLANMHEHHASRMLVRDLARALESRPVIDQAKGILMREWGCTADQAFQLLIESSQQSNRKLREVAGDLVDSASRSGQVPPA